MQCWLMTPFLIDFSIICIELKPLPGLDNLERDWETNPTGLHQQPFVFVFVFVAQRWKRNWATNRAGVLCAPTTFCFYFVHNSRHQNWLRELGEWPQKSGGIRGTQGIVKGSWIIHICFHFLKTGAFLPSQVQIPAEAYIIFKLLLHECLKSLNLYLTESHWSINSKLPLSKFSVFGRSREIWKQLEISPRLGK